LRESYRVVYSALTALRKDRAFISRRLLRAVYQMVPQLLVSRRLHSVVTEHLYRADFIAQGRTVRRIESLEYFICFVTRSMGCAAVTLYSRTTSKSGRLLLSTHMRRTRAHNLLNSEVGSVRGIPQRVGLGEEVCRFYLVKGQIHISAVACTTRAFRTRYTPTMNVSVKGASYLCRPLRQRDRMMHFMHHGAQPT
jgi:hypothetical protein